MQVSQINGSASFKGRIMDYNTRIGKSDLMNNSYWQKNSSVEDTLGSFRNSTSGKVYFADPLEKVSDAIKESVDYVVYDNEPSYPDVNEEVSKNYFGTLRKNFKNDFEDVRMYYYRREMGGFADKAEAEYQQWQAAECVRLYDKGGALRYQKEAAEDEIAKLKGKIDTEYGIFNNTKAELSELLNKKGDADNRIYYLSQKNRMYKALQPLTENPLNEDKNEKALVESQIKNIKSDIDKYQKLSADYAKKIKNAEEYISRFPGIIKKFEMEIQNNMKSIEGIKARLIPLFDELKNFYVKQGIKVIKK